MEAARSRTASFGSARPGAGESSSAVPRIRWNVVVASHTGSPPFEGYE